MEQFFYGLARQNLTAGWMILALLVLRPLLKKAPRAVSCLLWGLAAVRLAFPFSLESPVSLVPQQIAAPIRVTLIDPVYYNSPALQTGTPAASQMVSQGISWREAVPYVWLIGVAAMAIYALVSYLRLSRRVRISVRVKERVYLCDQVSSPFVLGIFRPKIYLPSQMHQPMTDHVLSHERAHLRRGDHLWKPLGYCLLSIYWFNPLCWLAYILFCRDMEQACDEAVIKNMTPAEKKAYSAALLQCSLPRSAIAACPVAFGQISIKQRIQRVLNYRKPALWVVAASAVLCMVLAACFLTDPVKANDAESGKTESSQEYPLYSGPDESTRIVRQLVSGEDYTILRTEPIGNSLWAYVECQDGKTYGWLLLGSEQAASIQIPEVTTLTTGTVIGPKNLNVRSGPGLDYPTVGFLTPGSQVTISTYEIGINDNLQWGCIGGDSWVCMSYIECQKEDAGSNVIEATQYVGPSEQSEEIYTFPQQTKLYSVPSERSRETSRAEAGEDGTILRREFIISGSWGFVQLQNGAQGWVHFVEEDEALNYFRDYVEAFAQPTPEAAEGYLYFASDYAREFFRDHYASVTGWYPSGIFRVNDNLWGIQFEEPTDGQLEYSFVGRMDQRLYVFRNVHQVPAQLSENLNVAAYERENAMYLSEGYLECTWVQKRLIEFRYPVQVELQEDGTRDYAGPGCAYEDVIWGTDTWREASRPGNYGSPSCTVRLTAADGSIATIVDSFPVVEVSRPDGSKEWYQAAYTGEELVGCIYSWAKELAARA